MTSATFLATFGLFSHYDDDYVDQISSFITALKKTIKKKLKKKSKKKSKTERLNLKNIQNPWKFFWKCFARALAQTFLRAMKLICFLRFFLCKNFFQSNFSPETEIAKLFKNTKRKCIHVLFSDGMFFMKTKFESFSFEKMKFKNKFYFELKVYNSLGFCFMLYLFSYNCD